MREAKIRKQLNIEKDVYIKLKDYKLKLQKENPFVLISFSDAINWLINQFENIKNK